jgi:hypothetical protein
MSIESEIRPQSKKIPYAEITRITSNGWEAGVEHFEGMWGAKKGNAVKALLNVAVCRQINIPDLQLNIVVESLGKYLTKSDSVIIMHGPFAERVGGVPEVGHDNNYCGWHGTAENDNELTVLSTLPSDLIKTALRYSQNSLVDTTVHEGTSSFYDFRRSDWNEPSWNSVSSKFRINEFFTTQYSYFRNEYPAIDFHFVTGADPTKEFLTIYGNRYSNIFGQRFLACFINPDGSLEQRIWQPVKPERAPKEHFITLIDKTILNIPWLIPEAVKMAIDTIRYSSVTKLEASIDKLLVEEIREALAIQSALVKQEKGKEWLERKARKKLETAYYRAGLFDEKDGKNKINKELSKIGWFDAVGIKP